MFHLLETSLIVIFNLNKWLKEEEITENGDIRYNTINPQQRIKKCLRISHSLKSD